MTEAKRQDANQLMRLLQGRIKADDTKVEASTSAQIVGKGQGRPVSHARIHLIPRRKGDMTILGEE